MIDGAEIPLPGRYGPPAVPPPDPCPRPAPSPSPMPVPWPVPVPPPAPGPWLSVSGAGAVHGMPTRSRGSAATATTGATTGGSGSAFTGGGSITRMTGGGSTRGGGRRIGSGLRSALTPLSSAGGGGAGSLWPPPPPPPPGPGATRNTSRMSFLSGGVSASGFATPRVATNTSPASMAACSVPASANGSPGSRRMPAAGRKRVRSAAEA